MLSIEFIREIMLFSVQSLQHDSLRLVAFTSSLIRKITVSPLPGPQLPQKRTLQSRHWLHLACWLN